jgi:uncharacterized membrane protein
MTSGRGTAPGLRPPRTPGLLFGLGLGGFIDGIVLHQILQWHHMLSAERSPATLAGLEVNTVADGFFHLGTWLLVVAASITSISAWRQGRLAPNVSFHGGLLLAGWGIFDVVEGLVDHQILGIHHVRDDLGAPLSWDIGFLVLGAALAVGGWALYRRGLRALDRTATTRVARSPGLDPGR